MLGLKMEKESSTVTSYGGEGTWMRLESTISLKGWKNHFLKIAKKNAKDFSALVGHGQKIRMGKQSVT